MSPTHEKATAHMAVENESLRFSVIYHEQVYQIFGVHGLPIGVLSIQISNFRYESSISECCKM